MQKTTLIGVVLEQTPNVIVMQEGEAVARYSKDYYRLPNDQDETSPARLLVWTGPLPVEIQFSGDHGVLVPVYS